MGRILGTSLPSTLGWKFLEEHFTSFSYIPGASPMTEWVKNLPAMQETQEMWVQPLGWEDPWRRKWQPTPVFLPGESPWTEEPGRLQSMGSQRVGPD